MNYLITNSTYMRKRNTTVGIQGGFSQRNNVSKGREGFFVRFEGVKPNFGGKIKPNYLFIY